MHYKCHSFILSAITIYRTRSLHNIQVCFRTIQLLENKKHVKCWLNLFWWKIILKQDHWKIFTEGEYAEDFHLNREQEVFISERLKDGSGRWLFDSIIWWLMMVRLIWQHFRLLILQTLLLLFLSMLKDFQLLPPPQVPLHHRPLHRRHVRPSDLPDKTQKMRHTSRGISW